VSLLLLLAGIGTTAQTHKRLSIQRPPWGTSTQLGKIYDVNISEQFSTPEGREALIDAFTAPARMLKGFGSTHRRATYCS